jgi:hypothetical protein
MNIDINEDTRTRNGSITIDGQKRSYTAFCNRRANSYEVTAIISSSFGGIVDAFSRNVSFDDLQGGFMNAGSAIDAAFGQWKADQRDVA